MTVLDPALTSASAGASAPGDRLAVRRQSAAPLRAAIALARERLRRAPGARPGLLVTLLMAFGVCVTAVVLRAVQGGTGSIRFWMELGTGWLAWVAGAPLALAIARDRPTQDREDGIDALLACRGISVAALESIRMLAAMQQVARAIGVPAVVVCMVLAAMAGSLDAALAGVRMAVAVAVFSVVVGVVVGATAAICGRVGRRRGRSLLLAVVLGPWLLASLAGPSVWSIPGVLNALLVWLLRLAAPGVA